MICVHFQFVVFFLEILFLDIVLLHEITLRDFPPETRLTVHWRRQVRVGVNYLKVPNDTLRCPGV